MIYKAYLAQQPSPGNLTYFFLPCQMEDGSTPEPKENWEENCHQNGLSLPLEEGENLSHSLEAEHR